MSTAGDPNFVFNEPLLGSDSSPSTYTWIMPQEDDQGGACGTVDMTGGSGGPGGFMLKQGLEKSLAHRAFLLLSCRRAIVLAASGRVF